MIDRVLGHVRRVPADLRVIVAATVVSAAFVLTSAGFRPTATPFSLSVGGLVVRVSTPATLGALSGLLLLLLLPGYVAVAAIFPSRRDRGVTTFRGRPDGVKLSTAERIALSLGLGVTMLTLLGLGIAISPWGYSTEMATALAVVTVVAGTGIAVLRGHSTVLDPDVLTRARLKSLLDSRSLDRGSLLSLLLAASVVAALGTLGVAVLVPNDGADYTEFAVLKPDASGGPVAAGYSIDGRSDAAPREYLLRVRNRENAATEYTVVVREERLSPGPSETTISERREHGRFQAAVAAGDTRQIRTSVTPRLDGGTRRIAFYLYRGTPPDEAAPETAYRELYVWISEPGAAG